MGIVGSTGRGHSLSGISVVEFQPDRLRRQATTRPVLIGKGCLFVATWLRPMPRDQRPYLPIEKETIVVAVSSQSKRHTSRE